MTNKFKYMRLRTLDDHSMMLEAQDVGDRREKILQVADELARNPGPRLWD